MKVKGMRRELLAVIGACMLAAPLAAPAQESSSSRPYSVVSLLGDKISLVGYVSGTGSHIDTNTLSELPLSDNELDRATLFAVEDALRKKKPDLRPSLLSVRDPAIYGAQQDLAGPPEKQKAFISSLKAVLKERGTGRFVIVTKQRGEARLQARDGHFGKGSLNGLGFYLDRVTPMQSNETGLVTEGFLGPFAYVRVSLVDMDSLTVLKDSYGMASNVLVHGAVKGSIHPWDALDAGQKVEHLKQLIAQAVERAMGPVLSQI
jgi:hypothetical protein